MEKVCKVMIVATLSVMYIVADCADVPVNVLTLHFVHANVFHLLANCWAVWCMKRANWLPSYAIAVLCSLPFSCMVGFSGVVFAALGIIHGRYPSRLFVLAVGIVLLTGVLPGISAVYHLVCLSAGFVSGYVYQIGKLYAEYRNR